jgi:hypothetical protein
MFEQTFVSAQPKTVDYLVAFIGQTIFITVAVILPMIC